MALDWKLDKIENYKKVCWHRGKMNPLTSVLIYATITVGMCEITSRNYKEFFLRLNFREQLRGRYFKKSFITLDDVKKHIGLHTNASKLTRTACIRRMVDSAVREIEEDIKRYERAAHSV